MLNFTISISKKAGNYLLKEFKKNRELISKRNVAKLVRIKEDKGSNKIIIREILKKYPNHNILSEESKYIDNKSNYTWIIDPLDGSSNFANCNPFFAVSIALIKNNELLLGVINAPFLKELFTAEKNKGSFLNGKKIHVSNIRDLKKSYILSCEGGERNNKRIAKLNKTFHPITKDLRKLGSAAIEACWIACGRAEIYIAPNIYPWDIAAGILLVKEAHGLVTDFKGKEWNKKREDLIFTNGRVHKKILNYIKKLN